MPLLLKSAAAVLSTAFWIALTLTFVQGFRLAHVGWPYAEFPLARHKYRMRWSWILMIVTLIFIELTLVPYFGRQRPPLFPFHLFCSISTFTAMLIASIFNPTWKWMERRPGIHHLFGRLAWAFGTASVLTGDLIIIHLRLPP